MACGTGKSRIIRELAKNVSGKVLITVPSRLLLEQFAAEFPSFCKVGTGYNKHINRSACGFIAVADSANLLQDIRFEAVFVDEAHHPLPSGLPECEEIFLFSATHYLEADFEYSMGQAIKDGVLCDYDLTVPIITDCHPYLSLAKLLQSSQGRFRRVLAYCNSVAEAKRVQEVFKTSGMAVWHINAATSRWKRKAAIEEFAGSMLREVHVLVTVQVLGEGVNIPNADTCLFVQPRNSYTSIIQALGRILRKHVSKPMAHVILPAVAMHSDEPMSAVVSAGDSASGVGFHGSGDSPTQDSSLSSNGNGVLPASAPATSSRDCNDLPTSGAQSKSGFRNQNESAVLRGGIEGAATDASQLSPVATAALENVNLGNRVRQESAVSDVAQKRIRDDENEAKPPQCRDGSLLRKGAGVTTKRRVQSRRLKFSSSLLGQTRERYDSQLERFLAVIAHADCGLVDSPKSLRFRLSFVDCRSSRSGNALLLARSELLHTLVGLIDGDDRWESRVQELEGFVRQHGRLPTIRDMKEGMPQRSLFTWVKNTGRLVTKGRLPPDRYQRLLNSSLVPIRTRALAWKDPGFRFRRHCERLRDFVEKFQTVPKSGRAAYDVEGKYLACWLHGQRRTVKLGLLRSGTRSDACLRRESIAAVHPLVADYVQSWDTPLLLRPRRDAMKKWSELVTYVKAKGRLPRSHRDLLQNRLYQRLVRLKERWTWLAEKEQHAVLKSHRLIAEFLQKP
ncbi:IRC3 [Symbiodinium necroappetens]|uniref:IRC3 protein n=1 Tax=Symbiodinium necroappetens TaxID=1628268 RepID=A0A812SZR0_9DINO|nr:IRC3 [Symbiodinium necroappetens]